MECCRTNGAGHRHAWLPAEVEELARLWQSGASRKQIAIRLRRSRDTINRKIEEYKLPPRVGITNYSFICHRCRGEFQLPLVTKRKAYCDPCLAIRRQREGYRRRNRDGIQPAFRHSDEIREKVAARWKAGESSTLIAQALGLKSKNAVIGLISRMGLSNQRPKCHASIRATRQRKLERRASKPARIEPPKKLRAKRPVAVSSSTAPAPLNKSLIDLTNKECHWPVETGYCGHPKWEHHKSYCEHHAAEARR